MVRRKNAWDKFPSWLRAANVPQLPKPHVGLPAITSLPELRQYADSVIAQLPLLSGPRNDVLRHTFRTLQTGRSLTLVTAGDYDTMYHGARTAQDLLRYLTFKVFELCPPGAGNVTTGPVEARAASHTIDMFSRFSTLHDAILAVERGFQSVDFDSRTHRVTFYYNDEQAQAKLGHSIVEGEVGRRSQFGGFFSKAAQALPKLRPLLTNFTAGIGFDARTMVFTCDISDEILQVFMEYVRDSIGPSEFPPDISLGPYTIGEFRDFWLALKSFSELHEFGLMTVLADSRMLQVIEAGPVANAPFSFGEDQLVELVCRNTSIRDTAAREILRDLTYDPKRVNWVDIIHQPLVPVEGTQRLCLPVVVSQSNFERNLLALVDRVPWRREGATALKDVRERLMISDLLPRCEEQGFHVRGRIPLRSEGKERGDIDLLVWDKAGKNALLISLKWFYGPDSVQEVWQHDEWYREAVKKHEEDLRFFRETVSDQSRRFDLGLRTKTSCFGAVVSKHDSPTGYVERAEIPVVTQTQFREALIQCEGSIELLHRHLEALGDEPRPSAGEIRESAEEIQFGEYRLKLPVVEYRD